MAIPATPSETGSGARRATLGLPVCGRISKPAVPQQIRTDFWFSALGAMASWSVLGVLLSLYPSLAAHQTQIDNLVFSGGVVGAFAFSAVATDHHSSTHVRLMAAGPARLHSDGHPDFACRMGRNRVEPDCDIPLVRRNSGARLPYSRGGWNGHDAHTGGPDSIAPQVNPVTDHVTTRRKVAVIGSQTLRMM